LCLIAENCKAIITDDVSFFERGRVLFLAAIDGSVYAKHGAAIDTRLTVIDRLPPSDPTVFPALHSCAPDAATLLG
jgi:hypothetical protein